MRHYDILFDREREEVHITRSNCSEDYEGPTYEETTTFSADSPPPVPRNRTKPKPIDKKPSKPVSDDDLKTGMVFGILASAIVILVIIGLIVIIVRKKFWRRDLLLKEKDSSSDDKGVEIISEGSVRAASSGKKSSSDRNSEEATRVPQKYVNNSKMLQQIDEVDSNVMSINYLGESPDKADNLNDPISPSRGS